MRNNFLEAVVFAKKKVISVLLGKKLCICWFLFSLLGSHCKLNLLLLPLAYFLTLLNVNPCAVSLISAPEIVLQFIFKHMCLCVFLQILY